jgi:hypothetical protein
MARTPVNTPPEWTNSPRTGTVDEEDQPEDEREDENEAPVASNSERTETPEEFEESDGAEDPSEPVGGAE